MTAVTQIIPNYLGGVSRQPDEKKSPGQVIDILNGYPDPTNGLTKRNGLEFVATLDTDTSGLDDAAWFFINRDAFELYFGCITTEGKFRIWDVLNRIEIPEEDITTVGRSGEYLEPGLTFNDYKFLTVQDVVFIVNKTARIKQNYGQDSTFNYLEHPLPFGIDNVATVKCLAVEYNMEYELFLKNDYFDIPDIKYTTPNASASGQLLKASEILQSLANEIPKKFFNVTVLNTSLEIESKPFEASTIDDGSEVELRSDKYGRLYFLDGEETVYPIGPDGENYFEQDGEYTAQRVIKIDPLPVDPLKPNQELIKYKLAYSRQTGNTVISYTYIEEYNFTDDGGYVIQYDYNIASNWVPITITPEEGDPYEEPPANVTAFYGQEDLFNYDFDRDKLIGFPSDEKDATIDWTLITTNGRDSVELYYNQYQELGYKPEADVDVIPLVKEIPEVEEGEEVEEAQPLLKTNESLDALSVGYRPGSTDTLYLGYSKGNAFKEVKLSLGGEEDSVYEVKGNINIDFDELYQLEEDIYYDVNKDSWLGDPDNDVDAPPLPPAGTKNGFAFTIEVKSGRDGKGLDAYQSEVETGARLAADSVQDRRVKVLNTADDKSSYFVRFIANQPDDPKAGNGYWEEDLGWEIYEGDPDVEPYNALASYGVQEATMPHVLKVPAPGKFEFSTYPYVDRLVGSELSNPSPTFVDSTITNIFLDNNRLGFLAGENVILSQSGEFGNFYFTSAKTVVESDPIDLNCSSIRPAKLHSALPTSQGLVLFSKFEQFMLFSESGTLTPSDSVIRSISKYETDPLISPVDVGTSIMIVSKTPSSTRTMGMVTRGLNDNPIVVDISKVASDYVPPTIDLLTSSPQNSFIAMSSKDDHDMYFYKFFNNGQQDVMQAWFRWELSGDIQSHIVAQDTLFIIIRNENGYQLLQSPLSQATLIQDKVNLRFDNYFACNDPQIEDQPFIYDSVLDRTKLPSPYQVPSTGKYIAYITSEVIVEPQVLSVEGAANRLHYVNEGNEQVGGGFISELIIEGDSWYIKGDWTGTDPNEVEWRNRMIIGKLYNLEVELPTTYFRIAETVSDFTSSLTLARYRFSLGETGEVNFLTKAMGSDEWQMVAAMTSSNYYNADTPAATTHTLLTVPIYQRNTNFQFKIQADTPLPVSINSMMWEGKYVPRNYRRA
tara:strand:+ start:817 stop:4329 length:3513 start_codon:yes stop_codon:yes gene_type:complete